MNKVVCIPVRMLIVLCLLAQAVPSLAQGEGAILRGEEADGYMKLYWETYEWPEDLYGFNIKKKNAGDSQWHTLNGQVIYPQVDKREWTQLGLNAADAAELQKTFERYVASGAVNVMTKEVLLQKLRQAGGLQSGDRIRMTDDYDLALIFGFAFMDRSYKKNEQPVYGLFYVDEKGNERAKPAATFSPGKKPVIRPEVNFKISRNRISLRWSLKRKDNQLAGINGFRIYRISGKSKQKIALATDLLGYQDEKGDELLWRFQDQSGDPASDHTYILVPVTIFQTELPPVTAKYKAAEHQPIRVPALDSVKQVNEVNLQLFWSPDSLAKDRKRIRELFVGRMAEDSLNYTTLTKLSSVKSKSFTDTSALVYGKRYSYRLEATDLKGKKWYGEPYDVLFTGMKLPVTPDSLKAEFKVIRDIPYVVLSWTSVRSKHLAGYRLQTDESVAGTFLENNSIPLITGNQFLYELTGDGGRKIRFKIVPVGPTGVHGQPASVACEVPLLRLPGFDEFSARMNKIRQVELNWEYPKDIPLQGFKVMADDKVIASLPAVERKYTVRLYTQDQYRKTVMYTVEAIGVAAIKKSGMRPVYLPSPEIKIPENASGKLQREKNNVYAMLSWEKAKALPPDVQGYLLFADLEKEGVFAEITPDKLLKSTQYKFLLPDISREKYTFYISAVSANGEAGPAAEVTIHLKDLKK